jgi:hypothetical protein
MFECLLCNVKTKYPSEWKRHINLLKHQKLARKNKELSKEEHNKNTNIMLQSKKNKLNLKITRLNGQILDLLNKTNLKVSILEEELLELNKELHGLE